MSSDRYFNPLELWLQGIIGFPDFALPKSVDTNIWVDTRKLRPVGQAKWWPGHEKLKTSPLVRSGKPSSDGTINGLWPIQAASERMQTVTVTGHDWMGNSKGQIPIPANNNGWIHAYGHPNPWGDAHTCLVQPDGTTYQTWGDHPTLGRVATITKYSPNGEILEGEGGTAGAVCIGSYALKPSTFERPHVLGLMVPDYPMTSADGRVKDGALPDGQGYVRLNDFVVLDRDHPFTKSLFARGGKHAELAEIACTHGAMIVDRVGYADASARNIGSRPRNPSLWVEACREAASWGFRDVEIPMDAWLLAQPVTDLEPEPDPRIEQIFNLGADYINQLEQLLDGVPHRYSAIEIAHDSVVEAIRLIQQQGGHNG